MLTQHMLNSPQRLQFGRPRHEKAWYSLPRDGFQATQWTSMPLLQLRRSGRHSTWILQVLLASFSTGSLPTSLAMTGNVHQPTRTKPYLGNVSSILVLSRTVCLFPTQMFRIPILFRRVSTVRSWWTRECTKMAMLQPAVSCVNFYSFRNWNISCLLAHHQVSVEAVCVVSFSQDRSRFGALALRLFWFMEPANTVTWYKNNPLRVTTNFASYRCVAINSARRCGRPSMILPNSDR